MRLLPTNLAKLAEITTESSRFALDGIHVKFDSKDESFMVEATDAKSLIRVTGKVGAADQYPTGRVLGLDEQPDGGTETVIAREEWKDIFTNAAKETRKVAKRKPVLGSVAVAIDKKTMATAFGYTNMEDSGSLHKAARAEGRFPATDDMVIYAGRSEKTTTIRVDARKLAELLNVIASLHDKDEEVRVDIEIPAATPSCRTNEPLVINSKTDTLKILALFMRSYE